MGFSPGGSTHPIQPLPFQSMNLVTSPNIGQKLQMDLKILESKSNSLTDGRCFGMSIRNRIFSLL